VRELARSLGTDSDPSVIADRSNLVLELRPHPIVARVAMATSQVRTGMAWLRREVEISAHLQRGGAGVTEPSDRLDPGPFDHAGLIVSFWKLERIVGEPAGEAVGRTLARVHRLLVDYPRELLPEWGAWTEARVAFSRVRWDECVTAEQRVRLERAWDVAEGIVQSSVRRSRSYQAVHGDAHVRNVLGTERGTLWTDWEDAFLGPVEWDLACLRSRLELFGEERQRIEAACAAYDRNVDLALVRDLTLVRNIQVIPWLAIFCERDPTLRQRMIDRIERLPC
jgi:hypothetical protein